MVDINLFWSFKILFWHREYFVCMNWCAGVHCEFSFVFEILRNIYFLKYHEFTNRLNCRQLREDLKHTTHMRDGMIADDILIIRKVFWVILFECRQLSERFQRTVFILSGGNCTLLQAKFTIFYDIFHYEVIGNRSTCKMKVVFLATTEMVQMRKVTSLHLTIKLKKKMPNLWKPRQWFKGKKSQTPFFFTVLSYNNFVCFLFPIYMEYEKRSIYVFWK